ncbi:cysteine desulfurase [Vibrio ishigakensis]|uniref:Cysteine desulfurase n=1 Tax=Vibrio ishigakensis TaxID=1481914 RepID=A0A0B8Q718_9VIBR|nr:cysteine desulfurase [Vibrio ishigakensis]
MMDAHKLASQFPSVVSARYQGIVLADGPGGAQFCQSAIEAVTSQMQSLNANLGGEFEASRELVELTGNARQSVATLINAESPNCISFGPNMTSLAFHFSRMLGQKISSNNNILVTELDHHANVSCWHQVSKDSGCELRVAPCDAMGELDIESLLSLIDDSTSVVALTGASNITGSITNLSAIIAKAHKHGAIVFVDAVHLAPHCLIDVQALDVDILLASGYKFFAPHVGIAYVKPSLEISPIKVSAAPDARPNCFETGTVNFPALSGLNAAIHYLGTLSEETFSRQSLSKSFQLISQHEQTLSERFIAGLKGLPKFTLYGRATERTPTFALSHIEVDAPRLAKQLAEQGVNSWAGHMYAEELIKRIGLSEREGS